MPKPKDAKVWNEDLLQAMQARYHQARQQNSNRQMGWSRAAEQIEAVRQDIYRFATGRIVGLPTCLSKTAAEQCRQIINGQAPVLPPGYIPTTIAEQQNTNRQNNPYDNHPYLNKIKKRGGAFAILMAFYVSGNQTMTKDQICRAAQPFCDEMMEANYMGGRPHGAWSANKTLVNHNLIAVQKARIAYSERAGGLRAQGQSSYTLTRQGEQFLEAMIRKNPQLAADLPSPVSRNTSSIFGGAHGRNPIYNKEASLPPRVAKVSPTKSGGTKGQDERKLREWVEKAQISEQIVFKVGKDRRKHLHDLCDQITSSVLLPMGQRLLHESEGHVRGRQLYITLVASSMAQGFEQPSAYSQNEDKIGIGNTSSCSPPRVRSFAGPGSQLIESPTKRARMVTPRDAAANAALTRQAMHESKMMGNKAGNRQQQRVVPAAAVARKTIVLVDDDKFSEEDDCKPAARPKALFRATGETRDNRKKPPTSKSKSTAKPNSLFGREYLTVESDDDDDDIELVDYKDPFAVAGGSRGKLEKDPSLGLEATDVVDLTESQETEFDAVDESSFPKTELPQLLIWIDDRERTKNSLPRHLRMELNRLLDSRIFSTTAPVGFPRPIVEEKQLSVGDFAFAHHTNAYKNTVIPVALERKRIGDLVQRSSSGDHWRQLQGMRDSSEFSVLLLEGDFRGAGTQFSPYGDTPDHSTLSHDIEDEESLVRFLGRVILGDARARFIQTKDEQGSLRAVSALGLVSALAKLPVAKDKSLPPKKEQQQLRDRLNKAGLPWQISACVAKEIGSTKELEKRYLLAASTECKEQLLSPLLIDDYKKVDSSSSALGWSKAVFHAFQAESKSVKVAFEDMKHLVEDQALLFVNLHMASSSTEALDSTLEDDRSNTPMRRRKVEVSICPRLRSLFQAEVEADGFFKLNVIESHSREKFPCISILTSDGRFESSPLNIYVAEGSEVIALLLSSLKSKSHFYNATVESTKVLVESLACQHNAKNILLVRGLQAALDHQAKQLGYLPELKLLVDVFLSHLMIEHDLVVLQAVRKSGDAEIMVQQLTMACYLFQPLICLCS